MYTIACPDQYYNGTGQNNRDFRHNVSNHNRFLTHYRKLVFHT